MKTLVKNYTFNKTTKQITINNLNVITNEQLLLITNVTDGIIIYNFADPLLGATISGNVITLEYDTTTMDNTDDLQIFIDTPNAQDLQGLAQVMITGFASIVSQLETMKTAQGFPDPYGRLRTVVETLPTLSTVGTVNNIASVGGYYPQSLVFSETNIGWGFLRNMIKIYGGTI